MRDIQDVLICGEATWLSTGFGSSFPIPLPNQRLSSTPLAVRLPAGMVDYSNPVVITQDLGTCAVNELGIQRTCQSFNSGDGKALARHIWSVHVRLPVPCCPTRWLHVTQRAGYSWEYFTTFDYEWSVIQGRPYPWTIWVCTGERH